MLTVPTGKLHVKNQLRILTQQEHKTLDCIIHNTAIYTFGPELFFNSQVKKKISCRKSFSVNNLGCIKFQQASVNPPRPQCESSAAQAIGQDYSHQNWNT
uniref:Uncharacterized protein n=1 Tax=Anguilla anguilla TaxID=7936 RepID=A0A0E9W920_ANGAN